MRTRRSRLVVSELNGYAHIIHLLGLVPSEPGRIIRDEVKPALKPHAHVEEVEVYLA